ncbi:hypothetical protein LOTGIDRAFT_200149, partial [Lottia gigantea]
MASCDKIERLRERLLVCPICMDEYKDPRLLPCHHTVCFECIGNIVRSSSTTGRLFRCPQCRTDVFVPREGIESFPISFYILSVQDELGVKRYTSSCDICQHDWMQSQFKCIDCDLDICRFCIHQHRLFHHDSCRHGIIRIESISNSAYQSSTRTCPSHSDEILQLYCSSCEKAVCITCSCEDHKTHDTMPMRKKLRQAQKQLQCELDSLIKQKQESATLIDEIQTSIDKVKESASKALDGIQERHKHLQKILEKMVTVKKETLKNEERKNLLELNTFQTDLKSYFDQLENGVNFLEELQEGDMCLELLDDFENFQKSLTDERKQLIKKRLNVNQMSFTNGVDYQLGLLDFVALKFGSLTT